MDFLGDALEVSSSEWHPPICLIIVAYHDLQPIGQFSKLCESSTTGDIGQVVIGQFDEVNQGTCPEMNRKTSSAMTDNKEQN
jgi:hypothetical protein